ncbi:PDGLE domain-containing protein [Persephonella sp. KM09-Lau-8]|uniref:PDGLE domain-containing protein n=1 Tax=Persephonella sp. KM09-Lau-8 TaxID=1158345 RepID=UPI00049618D3|nr:PDGLE domain-containing protein [Persephonella sp. KM09-Lau-8]
MHKRFLLPVILLLAAVPLGLLTDKPAWGEWEQSFYKQVIGFIPEGMKNEGLIKAVIPDYSLNDIPEVLAYYLSAIVGISVIFLFFYMLKGFNRSKGEG